MKRAAFVAGAAAAAIAPRRTAAAPVATVRIGFLDSFSGLFADHAAAHRAGAELALADANRGGRVRFVFVDGDDASKPDVASGELRRLVSQEKVDVVFGATSSAVALATSALTTELGIFNVALGPLDSSLTGERAQPLTYRFAPNARMLLRPIARRMLAVGKRWYFLQADYALGRDAYAQLAAALRAAGGVEVGRDVVPLGTADVDAYLRKARASGADVLMLCNSGLDAANAARAFSAFGLGDRMALAGIALEDLYHRALPLDRLRGATFPVYWTPGVSDGAVRLARRLRRDLRVPLSSRHYFGYVAAAALIERIRAAGTTDARTLAAAFADHRFDAAKRTPNMWRACDHQCVQDVYAGELVDARTFAREGYGYRVVAEIPAPEADDACDAPAARAATAAITARAPGVREDYRPLRF